MTPDGAKALPCPFCGSNQTGFIAFNSVWACYDCESETGLASTEQEALKVWNRRTPDPATQRVLEAAKALEKRWSTLPWTSSGREPSSTSVPTPVWREFHYGELNELREAVEALAGREK